MLSRIWFFVDKKFCPVQFNKISVVNQLFGLIDPQVHQMSVLSCVWCFVVFIAILIRRLRERNVKKMPHWGWLRLLLYVSSRRRSLRSRLDTADNTVTVCFLAVDGV